MSQLCAREYVCTQAIHGLITGRLWVQIQDRFYCEQNSMCVCLNATETVTLDDSIRQAKLHVKCGHWCHWGLRDQATGNRQEGRSVSLTASSVSLTLSRSSRWVVAPPTTASSCLTQGPGARPLWPPEAWSPPEHQPWDPCTAGRARGCSSTQATPALSQDPPGHSMA